MEYTIYDIAEECGVSVATVSRVINKNSSVSEKTKQRILDSIKKHNYAPNPYARGLNKIGANIIGVMISDIGNPFFSAVVKGIEQVFQKEKYEIMLYSTENDSKTERSGLELFMQKQVDGIIIAGSRPLEDKNESLIKSISRKIPVILVNSTLDEKSKTYSVVVDEEKAGTEALQTLVDKGYTDIYFFGDPAWKTTQAKISAFKKTAKINNIPFSKDRIIPSAYGYQSGIEGVKELLARHVHFPILIFCASDLIAVGAMKELTRQKIMIPQQAALLGFSNIEIASLVTPALSTIDQKMSLLGSRAAELLVRIKQGHTQKEKVLFSEYELILRETT